jgi:hypothetical protein
MAEPITHVSYTGNPSTYQDQPFTAGDGNYGRSLNAHEANAPEALTGAVTSEGLYQDITAHLAALSAKYSSVNSLTVSPYTLLNMIRDACTFMLVNRSFVAR